MPQLLYVHLIENPFFLRKLTNKALNNPENILIGYEF